MTFLDVKERQGQYPVGSDQIDDELANRFLIL